MYTVRYPRGGGDESIYICESYSLKGKKKKRILERYLSRKELEAVHPDVDAFLNGRIADLLKEKEGLLEESASIPVDFSEGLDSDVSTSKNAGYLFLQKAYSDLGLEGFFNSWKHRNGAKISYSMNDAMRLMCYSRVIDPCSKLATSQKSHDFLEDFALSENDLCDSLSRIDSLSYELMRHLSRKCRDELGEEGETVYYDCTNFYFEIQEGDDEKGLRDYGVEKNHRPDPIVEFGLLLSDGGYPIGCSTFRGNESEKTSLSPLLEEAGEEATKARIICADAGLNTSANKKLIARTGRNYIFSQGMKGLDEDTHKWAIDRNGFSYYGKPNKKGERKGYKSRWIIRSNGLSERLIVRFDPNSRGLLLRAIDERVKRAKRFIANPSSLSLSKCQDGKEYLRKVTIDSDGVLIPNKSIFSLNDEMIAKEKAEAGFYGLVTDIPSEGDFTEEEIAKLRFDGYRYVPKDPVSIIDIAGKRNDIETCFKEMKTGMDARPIYVRLPEHIRGHLITVYVALVLLSFVKKKYLPNASFESLLSSLRNYSFDEETDGVYKTLYYDGNIKELCRATGMNLLAHLRISEKTKRRVVSISKNR